MLHVLLLFASISMWMHVNLRKSCTYKNTLATGTRNMCHCGAQLPIPNKGKTAFHSRIFDLLHYTSSEQSLPAFTESKVAIPMPGIAAQDLYHTLRVQPDASAAEIRRAYRTLVSSTHPDKPDGDAETFKLVQLAYNTLSDEHKRAVYDSSGKVLLTAEDNFRSQFGSGKVKHRDVVEKGPTGASLTIQQAKTAESHVSGFEAWLRARGQDGMQVWDKNSVTQKFGVVEGAYDAVKLHDGADITVPVVKCENANKVTGHMREQTELQVVCGNASEAQVAAKLQAQPLPEQLRYGEVLVQWRFASISPADLYTLRSGGQYGDIQKEMPFDVGHGGVGEIVKVGPGVTLFAQGDCVLPKMHFLGTWRPFAVVAASDLMHVPSHVMAPEYLCTAREMITAVRLLEDFVYLEPGDGVVINAANSLVGQCVIQLCALLGIRCIAVLHMEEGTPGFESTAQWLSDLGAHMVLSHTQDLQAELSKQAFQAKPVLALDSIGGPLAQKMASALAQGGHLVVYGCMSGRTPALNWQEYVFREIKVSGFNAYAWMSANAGEKLNSLLQSLSGLIENKKLRLNRTEYLFPSEFSEALDHATQRHKNTKVLLRFET